MIYNFHTHTARCRHASGEDEDYVKSAIEAGIKHLGFSDHIPFIFPDGFDDGYRIPLSEAEDYFKNLRALREKYRDQIEISIGFEMEYYPMYFDKMLDYSRNIGAEYLILGQHFILNEHPSGRGSVGPTSSEEHLTAYVSEVVEGLKTGVFSYLAHPDLVCFTGDEKIYRKEIKRICLASLDLDIPLEINLLGIRNGRHYPTERFWQIAGEVGSPVTLGIDAHSCNDLLDSSAITVATELINKYKLNYIGMAKIIDIHK